MARRMSTAPAVDPCPVLWNVRGIIERLKGEPRTPQHRAELTNLGGIYAGREREGVMNIRLCEDPKAAGALTAEINFEGFVIKFFSDAESTCVDLAGKSSFIIWDVIGDPFKGTQDEFESACQEWVDAYIEAGGEPGSGMGYLSDDY